MALSQRIFSKRKFPKGIFPSWNFPNVQFLKCQLPKSVLAVALALKPVLAAALGPLTHPSLSARPPLQPAAPLVNLHIWEVANWEILTWEVALGKMALGKYLKPKNL